jgi:uncharacterized protein involved in exopolysaccharide biosynthesis
MNSYVSAEPRAVAQEADHDGIDLWRVVLTLWEGRWVIIGTAALFGVLAVFLTLRMPNVYKATAVLMPSATSPTSSLAALAGQLGNLASLAGFNFGQDGSEKTIAAMELLKSWGFQEEFIRENNLEVPLFAARGWDRATNQLVIDRKLYDPDSGKWVRKPNPKLGRGPEPSGWELHRALAKRVSVVEDKKNGLITLSVEFYSPELAKQMVDRMIVAVNAHLQERDRAESARSITYLEGKLAQTDIVEMRTVLAQLVREQTKNLMLATVSDEYALRTLSAAKVPEQKARPNRAVLCIVLCLVGAFLGALLWLLWKAYRRAAALRVQAA